MSPTDSLRQDLELRLRTVSDLIRADDSRAAACMDEADRLERAGNTEQAARFRAEGEKSREAAVKSRRDADGLMEQLFATQQADGVVSSDTVALTPRQSVSDWARLKMPLDGRFAGEELSAGKYFKGLVTGEWENAGLERQAMSEGTLADGGYLVPTPLSNQIIDRARNQARVIQAGALTVPMPSQTLAIARVAQAGGDTTSHWKLEGDAITESALTLERVTLTAKSLTALVKSSVELFQDAENLQDVILQNFGVVLGQELDRVALYGSGTDPEPQGVANTSGVGAQDLGANGAQIGIPGDYLDALETLWDGNEEATGIIQAPRTELAIARKADTTGQPLRLPEPLASIPRFRTNQVPINQTHGTAHNASDMFMGDWQQLLIGVRLGITISVLRERYMDNGEIGFVAYMRADVQVARPAAFVVTEGIIP